MHNLELIAGISNNGIIGVGDSMPWKMPSDLNFFKEMTKGKTIIMGRRTWESLPGILPGRKHIVITSNENYYHDGIIVKHSLMDALENIYTEPAVIIGGSQIYAQALDLVETAYITQIDVNINEEQDNITYFPAYDWKYFGEHSAFDLTPHEGDQYLAEVHVYKR